jgi:hypothetical protein
MDADEPDVEEVLVLRVVSQARRRRMRRILIVAMLGLVAAAGVGLGLSHRSGAVSQVVLRPGHLDPISRAEIYAVARLRYAGAHPARRSTSVEFGALVIRDGHARLEVNLLCGPLCGHGEELTLVKTGDGWRVTGARTTWMS